MLTIRKFLALGIFRLGALLQLAGTPKAERIQVKLATESEYQRLKASFSTK
jgi:hypothetical protein